MSVNIPTVQELRTLARKHFPYEKYNKGQEQIIVRAVHAILTGKKHVIIQAPTGIGKSGISVVIHRMIQELKSTHRTTIITATKALQTQYTSEFHELFDLRGRLNYPCPKGTNGYGSATCRQACASGKCLEPKKICLYLKTRDEWCKVAKSRITNFSFQIEAHPKLTMEEDTKANVIIIDECHELPISLIDHNTLKLNTKDFFFTRRVLGDEFVGQIVDVIDAYMTVDVGTAFVPNMQQKNEMLDLQSTVDSAIEQLESDAQRGDTRHKRESMFGALEELHGISDKLDLFVNKPGEWILSEYIRNEKLELKPVYAHQVSQHGIFRKADQFVHMSATICGMEEYRKSLGIDESYVEIYVDNPIPVENRPVKIVASVRVSGQYDSKAVAVECDKIIIKHGQQNGVIHTVSFKLAEEIKANSKFKQRMVISNDRQEILSTLRKFKSGAIILSPSVETGYDFKGEMCEWQILAKVPYGSLGDPYIKLNLERSGKWYAREAILRLVQASGRCCRGINDYGITYIIDSNIERLIKQNHELFPDWYLESMSVMKG